MRFPLLQFIFRILLLGPLAWRSTPGAEVGLTEMRSVLVQDYANLATRLTGAAAGAAETLSRALERLRAEPTQANLNLAREAWMEARKAYLRTEPLRFGGGPIDDDDGPEQEINPWPIDPAVVNELLSNTKDVPRFTSELLRQRHQVGGVDQATVGFQVLAYLLWRSGEAPESRTTEYLVVCGEVLLEDLKSVATEWTVDKVGTFRAMFLEEPALAVQRIITGLALLGGGELATTRLQLPLDARERMETTSPYADFSQAEVRVTVDTLGAFWQILEGFAKLADPAGVDRLREETKRMQTLVVQLPKNFYEGGGAAEQVTHELILALEDQAASLRALGQGLGLNIPLEVGPEGE